jgi:hypothetical protein
MCLEWNMQPTKLSLNMPSQLEVSVLKLRGNTKTRLCKNPECRKPISPGNKSGYCKKCNIAKNRFINTKKNPLARIRVYQCPKRSKKRHKCHYPNDAHDDRGGRGRPFCDLHGNATLDGCEKLRQKNTQP